MTSGVIAFIFFALMGITKQQDGLICDMTSNVTRLASCPDGFCCARDQFLASYLYCKRLGTPTHRCTTVTSQAHCPCGPGLHCVPDVVTGTYKSIYGTCQNFSVVASTTAIPTSASESTVTTVKLTSSKPTASAVEGTVSEKLSTVSPSVPSPSKSHPTHPSTKQHSHATKTPLLDENINPVVG